ncbi:site-specific integrase [Hymenobacter sp. DG01]|uniref:tyrosine-type recombinase/integrase n=1 Tax=Hymenobacter sp. DG01 TaxID=2584940 RepID=UPI00111FA45F|nr:site-specific integrase [Hymenobacter sp. DG01]
MDFTKLAPRFADHPTVLNWLMFKSALYNADSTILSYSYVLSDYLAHCAQEQIDYIHATSQDVVGYFRALTDRPIIRNNRPLQRQLSDGSRKHRLAVLRLYYLYLKEESIRTTIPIRHGFSAKRKRGLSCAGELPVKQHISWIPDGEQWGRILDVMQTESLRNQLMLSLAFECALRRAELCALRISDVARGSGGNMVYIRAETTKTKRARRVYYSEGTKHLLQQYLNLYHYGAQGSDKALFISESKRNRGQGISVWTWASVIKRVAQRTRLPQLKTHTMRHLGITVFASKGWESPYVSLYAGHQHPSSTGIYLHPLPDATQHSIEQALVRLAQRNEVQQ